VAPRGHVGPGCATLSEPSIEAGWNLATTQRRIDRGHAFGGSGFSDPLQLVSVRRQPPFGCGRGAGRWHGDRRRSCYRAPRWRRGRSNRATVTSQPSAVGRPGTRPRAETWLLCCLAPLLVSGASRVGFVLVHRFRRVRPGNGCRCPGFADNSSGCERLLELTQRPASCERVYRCSWWRMSCLSAEAIRSRCWPLSGSRNVWLVAINS
jgi:hypothetical protein